MLIPRSCRIKRTMTRAAETILGAALMTLIALLPVFAL